MQQTNNAIIKRSKKNFLTQLMTKENITVHVCNGYQNSLKIILRTTDNYKN